MNQTSHGVHPLARLRDPSAVLDAAVDEFPSMVLATSLGPQSLVILHLLHELGRLHEVEVAMLDTGLLPAETHAVREAVEARFGIRVVRVEPEHSLEEQARLEGPALWETDAARCCALRKVAPMRRLLSGRAAWITGLRRDQGPTRARVETVQWDSRNGLIRVAPLAWWSRDRMWQHLLAHDLPYNRLLDQGYASVGCAPCTSPVGEGEEERAGRWRGSAKTECGLHG